MVKKGPLVVNHPGISGTSGADIIQKLAQKPADIQLGDQNMSDI